MEELARSKSHLVRGPWIFGGFIVFDLPKPPNPVKDYIDPMVSTFYAWPKADEPWIWKVDIGCGAQRWIGEKTQQQVGKALANCGFGPRERQQLLGMGRAVWAGRGG